MSGPDSGRSGDDERRERADRSGADGAVDGRPHSSETNGGRVDADASGDGRERQPDVTIEDDGLVRWYLKTDKEAVVITRDILSSVAIVAVIGLVLFGISGIWPPLVAVESGSMEPNMERGDLVFVVDNERFVADNSVEGTGVVPLERAEETGHEKFGNPGDVIVFQPDGSPYQTPVIHRAHFWVEEGENWVDTKADEEIIGGATCEQVRNCPAPHAGFITKGDANSGYDQHRGYVSGVVKPEWITGKASFRIPWLGHVRLAFDSLFASTAPPSPVIEGPQPASLHLEPSSPSIAAGAAGATGLAGASAGAVVAVGRYRT